MPGDGSRNVQQLDWVAQALGAELLKEVVFVGGCTTALLVEELAAQDARATQDVDFIVKVASYLSYQNFCDKLRGRGFKEWTEEDAIICRWKIDFHGAPLMVDVMPTDAAALGWTNRWYEAALAEAQTQKLPSGTEVQLVTPLYFLGTKFEAWRDRGKGDLYSSDIEDIVFVLENRPRLPVEFSDHKDDELKAYLAGQAQSLLENGNFTNTLPGLLSSDRPDMVLNTLGIIASHQSV